MGNQTSVLESAIKQFEAHVVSKRTGDWAAALSALNGLLPYWEPGEEGKKRYALDYKNPKALEAVLNQLSQELKTVNLQAREYRCDKDLVSNKAIQQRCESG
jgi:hypothetical protein